MKRNLLRSIAVLLSSCGALLPLAAHAEAYLTDGSSTMRGSPAWGDAAPHQASTTMPIDSDYAPRSDSVRGMLIAQKHRGSITSVVQALTDLANREKSYGGLGPESRRIAAVLQLAEALTTTAIEKVSSRRAIVSFFIGSDDASLALLRDGAIDTRHTLTELQALSRVATSSSDRALLTTQVKTIEDDQLTIQRFSATHKNTLGIFGWINGLFTVEPVAAAVP